MSYALICTLLQMVIGPEINIGVRSNRHAIVAWYHLRIAPLDTGFYVACCSILHLYS